MPTAASSPNSPVAPFPRKSLWLATLVPLILWLGSALPVSAAGDPVELSEWLPQWEVGLFWEVETQPLAVSQPKASGGQRQERSSEKITVRFEVTGRRDVKGNSCFEVTVTNDLATELAYVLVVREVDFTLAEFQTVHNPGADEQRSIRHVEPGPFVMLEETFLCPLDLPSFPADSKDGQVESELPGTSLKVIERRRFEGEGEKADFHVEIETEMNGEKLVSTQTWRKGGPWWLKASRKVGNREAEIGKLINVGHRDADESGGR